MLARSLVKREHVSENSVAMVKGGKSRKDEHWEGSAGDHLHVAMVKPNRPLRYHCRIDLQAGMTDCRS